MRNYPNTLQPVADRLAIGLSMLCALHCLALPLATALLPSLLGMGLEDESFHVWLVIIVIPLSAFALTLGCTKHRNKSVLYIGMLGLGILCLAPLLGHDLLGEVGERLLTLAGSILIALSHVRNFRLCRQGDICESH